MLIQLNIKNFALIEEITIEFKEGFNILSGETGAGKSILIDAIDYVLGGKFSKDLIRTGEDRTYVEAIFSLNSKGVKKLLDSYGVEYEDILIISRETTISGRSIIKINGKSFIRTQLKEIREKILDIHGQHQNQDLLQKGRHIEYLDNFISKELEETLEEFKVLKSELLKTRQDINSLEGDENNKKQIDYIKFQIEDIEKGKLSIHEENELKEEYNLLANAEKINKSLKISYGLLKTSLEGNSVIEALSKVLSEFNEIEKHIESFTKNRELLQEAFYNIEEISREVYDLGNEIIYDENRLSKINERIYEINNYKKKYGKTIEDVLSYYEELKVKYDDLINSEEKLKIFKKKENEVFSKMKSKGEKLHKIREKHSKELEVKILKELAYVGLEKSTMKIVVEYREDFNERGFDNVSFMISTNTGEPLKNLEKVLSGGELSRIMLALKCVFADKEDIATLIFDEIDTGISGTIANRVGEKMYQVSIGRQVLCITHLPQIAILSDNHYFVSKDTKDGKTYTKINLLTRDEKVMQIASMMGGNEITNATINNVSEMYDLAEKKKKEIILNKHT